MVRSTAISWRLGLAVTATALLSGPLPARADEGPAAEIAAKPQPIEPTLVRVTLLPPASENLISSWRPWPVEGATIVMVRPAQNTALAQPRPEQAAPTLVVQPADNAVIAQPRPEQMDPMSIMLRPAENAAIVQPPPPQMDALPVMLQPADTTPTAQPRAEPEKAQEDGALVEPPSLPERRPRVALLPPDSTAAVAAPRPELAKTQSDAASAAIPSLPGRSPFRQASAQREIVPSGQNTAAGFGQQAAEPAPAKGTAASRFLANLWPGNKTANQPISSTAQASPPSTGSLGPTTASSTQAQAQTAEKSDKPPIKRLLDGIQFWKN